MIQQQQSRPAAACGAFFAVGLFAAAGDGGYGATREAIATVALSVAIPFICYLGRLLRGTEGASTWIVDAAVAAGVTGIVLKLASGAPEVAQHHAHLGSGTPAYGALTALAAATTVISLAPLAVFCVATAAAILRTGALPRWVGAGALVAGVALAVNGCIVGTSFVPALPIFLLWTLLTSLRLLWASSRHQSSAIGWRRSAAQGSPTASPSVGDPSGG